MSADKKREPLRISVGEAKERADEKDVTFLDVVDPGSYENTDVIIEGAVRIDPRDVEEEYERLPDENEVLTYCT